MSRMRRCGTAIQGSRELFVPIAVFTAMELGKKVKISLDETRMLVLGVQILIGFQFRGVFQSSFDGLPGWSRYLDGVALLLLVTSFGLLILPGTYHRLVLDGKDSGRLQHLTGRVAGLALAPFAAGLAIDVAIAGERIAGTAAAVLAGIAAFILAIYFWYALGLLRARTTGQRERAMTEQQLQNVEDPGLHQRIDQVLTEGRVILPGAQALLGFQLVIVLTEAFEKMPPALKAVHGAALLLMGVSIVLLMAPAAYHRIVYAGEDSEAFHRTAGRFITFSTVPLALAMAVDVFVVGTKIVPSMLGAALGGVFVGALLFGLWHAAPLILRRRYRTTNKPASAPTPLDRRASAA